MIYIAKGGLRDEIAMGPVWRLAAEVARGLSEAHPKLRKTVVSKLALVVGAMIEARTPNTAELANVLPLDTERQAMREQWLRRLLKNPLLSSSILLKPWASARLADASRHGQMVVLSLDQTDLDDRFAVLMLGLVIGDRAVPWTWTVEAGARPILGLPARRRTGASAELATGWGVGLAVGRSLLSLH